VLSRPHPSGEIFFARTSRPHFPVSRCSSAVSSSGDEVDGSSGRERDDEPDYLALRRRRPGEDGEPSREALHGGALNR
jgi:hypothetical protein